MLEYFVSFSIFAFIASWLLRQLIRGAMPARCASRRRLDGKTAVVTGANVGIGFETARDLAQRGARVLIACRDVAQGENAARLINGDVDVVKLDLSDLNSIRRCAKHINHNEERLDILVNNAGLFGCGESRTADGYEMHMAVNHLGHFLLTNLLLDKMRRTGEDVRIVNVSSREHLRGKMHLDDLHFKQRPYSRT